MRILEILEEVGELNTAKEADNIRTSQKKNT